MIVLRNGYQERGFDGWYLFTAICLMHTTDRCYSQNLDPRHPFQTEIECISAIPTAQAGYRNSAVSYPAASWCERAGPTQQETTKNWTSGDIENWTRR
jgi:hypothetical protein